MYIILAFILLIIFLYWQNKCVTVSHVKYQNIKIPKEFDGFKVLQISDFHNTKFGKNLITKINSCNADIVVITGDIIDRRDYKLEISVNLIKQINLPIYFVSGNHEAWADKYDEIKTSLQNENVIVLENEQTQITKGSSFINIIGVRDPGFVLGFYTRETQKSEMEEYLAKSVDSSKFNLLLSHRPEIMAVYAKSKVDLVLTGHAHGGQVRLPWIGGLFAPNQGIFPKYDSGLYKENETTMYLSRGVGKSRMPIRLFNRPELVLVELKSKSYIE